MQRRTNRTIHRESLPFQHIDLSPDASHVHFRADDRAWNYTSDGALEEWNGSFGRDAPSPSSDGKASVRDEGTWQGEDEERPRTKTSKTSETTAGVPKVLVRDFNVWIADSAQQITTDGTKDNPYDADNIYISPSKQYAVVWQYTPDQDHPVYLVESSPKDQLQPKLKTIQYLKPGDRVRVDRHSSLAWVRRTRCQQTSHCSRTHMR